MALVVFLKGVNVGGYRSFRPSVLARQLRRLDVVNVGAAGTFVVREPVTSAALRSEVARRLPFEAEIMICRGSDIMRFTAEDHFAGHRSRPDVIRFVSILAKHRGTSRPVPPSLPKGDRWSLKVLGYDGRFVFGLHRREMKAIGYLGQLEKLFGVPMTTRSWSTMLAIRTVLDGTGRKRGIGAR